MAVTHIFEVSFDSLDATGDLTNPHFESNITGWGEADLTTAATLTPSHNTDTAHTRPGSTGSMKLINTASNEDDYMDDGFTTVSGRRYTISAWVKVLSFAGPAVFDRGLFVHEVGGSSGQVTAELGSAEADGEWHQLSVEFTSTYSGAFIRLYAPMGTTYWDDVQIVEWIDLSSRLLEVPHIRFGVEDDLSEMQAGSASFRLDNRDRALEPGYAASPYYPDVRPLRRCRYSIDDGSMFDSEWPQFYGYVVSWGPTWPGGMNQEAHVQAGDGSVILERDKHPTLDPPDADDYPAVVMHDEPFAYWRLGDQVGTKMQAVSGPEGTYHGMPDLHATGLLVGDSDTAVTFTASKLQFGRATVEQANQFSDPNAVSVEAWVTLNSDATDSALVTGPNHSVNGPIFALYYSQPIDEVVFEVIQSSGATSAAGMTTTMQTGRTYHFVGVWDGTKVRLYVDGVLHDTTNTATLPLLAAPANESIRIGRWGTSGLYANATIDEVAVYEHALAADRVLAHYQAGAQHGHGAVMAGERVAEVVDTGLWGLSDIDTGHHEVAPVQYHGQSRMDTLKDAVRAEFPEALFYFPGTNTPRYLGWNYGDASPYNTVQATFGNLPGEVPFVALDYTDEDDLYATVTTSRDGGLAQTATDPDAEAEFLASPYVLTGLIHTSDASCMDVSQAILAFHSRPDPPVRIVSLTLEVTLAATPLSGDLVILNEMIIRMPGDLIRIKHRPKGGTAIDIVTRIRGRNFSVAPLEDGNRLFTCTWSVGRGFNAAAGFWRAGITGFSEAGSTTVAA